MSINAAADEAVAMTTRPAAERRLEKTGGREKNPVAEAAKRATRHIPTEVVGTYLAIIGLFASGERTAQWVFYWLFLGLTGPAIWVTFAVKMKKANQPLPVSPRTWPWWALLAGVVSFGIWAIALPGSVWNTIDGYDPRYGGAAVLLWALVVGLVGQLFER